MNKTTAFRLILGAVKKHGLLLEADAQLPSVVSLIAKEPVKGSWWGHPLGNLIYNTASELHEHPEVLVLKLISGKVTFVHQELWPELLAVATSEEEWQTRKLTAASQALLTKLRRAGELRTDRLGSKEEIKAFGNASRQLEARLLAFAESIHTESGAHAKRVETWEHLSKRRKIPRGKIPVAKAKERFEAILGKLNERYGAEAWLPWS